MRRHLLTALATLLLTVGLCAQDCRWCGLPIEGEKVYWAVEVFCSEDCRQEFYLDRYRCKICNEKVEPKSEPRMRTDGVMVYIRLSPGTWDGFCDSCRLGVENGAIDPVRDRYRPEPPAPAPLPPVPVTAETRRPDPPRGTQAEPSTGRARDTDDPSDALVLGSLKWVLGIGVVVVLLIRPLLR